MKKNEVFSEYKREIIELSVSGVGLLAAFLITRFTEMPWYADLIIYLAVYLFTAREVLISSVNNLFKGEVFDENLLMAIASIGAMAIGEYPEAVAVILFYRVGELFQDIAVGRSKNAISDLMKLSPTFANLWTEEGWKKVEPSEIQVDSRLLVKSGEKIPVDGVIIKGETALEKSALTGEALPESVAEGDEVLSGSVNIGNAVEMSAKKLYADSTVAKILELVEKASDRKAKSEKFITKFSKIYTPAVVALAVLLAILPPLINKGGWTEWLNRALTFLVVSCPCALVISVPLGFFGGIGACSRLGVLVKGGNYLEILNKSKVFLTDKTGTITEGRFEVSEILPENLEKSRLLQLAASLEQYSTHPLASAIVAENALPLIQTRAEEIAGRGIRGEIDGVNYLVGNAKYLREQGVEFTEKVSGGTAVYVAADGKYAGAVVLRDKIKDSAREGIDALLSQKCRVVMLTGDNENTAAEVANAANIKEYKSGLLPKDKAEIVKAEVESAGKSARVAFIGDGINDAPALVTADLGIAMGKIGSTIAIESADIVLMNDDLNSIAQAKKKARKTLIIVKENICFSLLIKVAIMVLSAVGIFGGSLLMWIAVFGDVGVSILAVLNSIRVK